MEQNLVPSSKETSRHETCETRDSLIRKWLVRFGELYSYEISAEKMNIWVSVMREFPPATINLSFREVEKTFKPTAACPFPTPAHVREQITIARDVVEDQRAEDSWHRLRRWLEKNYHPDTGVRKVAAQVPEIVQHAARAAGGYGWLSNCPDDQLQWAKKAFVEDYCRQLEVPEAQRMLGHKDSTALLSEANQRIIKSLGGEYETSKSGDKGIQRI